MPDARRRKIEAHKRNIASYLHELDEADDVELWEEADAKLHDVLVVSRRVASDPEIAAMSDEQLAQLVFRDADEQLAQLAFRELAQLAFRDAVEADTPPSPYVTPMKSSYWECCVCGEPVRIADDLRPYHLSGPASHEAELSDADLKVLADGLRLTD